MSREELNIEQLYQDAFKNYKPERNDLSWFDIDSKVARVNFFKFSLTSFNIYYAALVVTTFTLASFLTVNQITGNSEKIPSSPDKELFLPVVNPSADDNLQVFENESVVSEDETSDNLTGKEKLSKEQSAEKSPGIESSTGKNKIPAIRKIDSSLLNSPEISIVHEDLAPDSTIILKEDDVIVRDTILRFEKSSRSKRKKR
ncbi:MAG: hypothetical protein JXJ22_07040 [Bacteroidales bacterium]|nr:hypothetical protein [Bacteroidales bacterium]